MDEERKSRRWLWLAIPAVLLVIAMAVCLRIFWPQLTTRVPDHVVNISGSIQSAKPADLVDATMSMQDQEMVSGILAEPEKWQGYELSMRLTNKCTTSNKKLEMIDWFVNPGQRWILTEEGYQYEKFQEEPVLVVGPYHADHPCALDPGTHDYNVNLVVNRTGKTAEELQSYVDNITIDVQTTLVWKDKEVDYVMTPITWLK